MKRITLILIFLMTMTVYNSPLSDLAQSMKPGEWGQLSTQDLVSASTGFGTGCSTLLIEYADNGVWDPVKALEEMRQILHRYSRSGISDLNRETAI